MPDKYAHTIREVLLQSAFIKQKLAQTSLGIIEKMSTQMVKSLRKGGKIVFFGNGGSASDSSHLAAEFIGRLTADKPKRKALPALALGTDTAVLTCLANDYAYSEIFVRPVEAFVGSKDTVIGISTSGNSENVLRGLQTAKKKGAFTMAFTGESGGKIAKQVKICLKIPSSNPGRIQEAYLCVGHLLCQLVEEELFS